MNGKKSISVITDRDEAMRNAISYLITEVRGMREGLVGYSCHNGLENNKWVMRMYNKWNRWAKIFFRDHFFVRVCSTQRCERLHRNLKGGLGCTMRLYDMFPRIDKTIVA
ncbi:hypothetical protein M0R45_019862 [Rubus argutus]|uniref:Protein FAR1-RELATED SEQUENCE n=1 Tax=Rubus argutus TaxID=59490 RepID=A0AAW1X8B8_RUBAR